MTWPQGVKHAFHSRKTRKMKEGVLRVLTPFATMGAARHGSSKLQEARTRSDQPFQRQLAATCSLAVAAANFISASKT